MSGCCGRSAEGVMSNDVGKGNGAGDDGGGRDDGPGCRPCCSAPHGPRSVIAGVISTAAFCLAMAAMNSCHFLTSDFAYCHPPPDPGPAYAFCGDCHCINGDGPCPTGDSVPPMDMSDEMLRQMRSVRLTNQMDIVCNPYNTTDRNCTVPPQLGYQIDLWEKAACGVKYNLSSLDGNQCPTEYSIHSYNSEREMREDGAFMTHWGACGVCSSLQDLAVYVEHPDLTAKGQECSIRGLLDFNDGVSCYQDVGYTRPCAEMWIYNGFNTRDHCFDVCVDFTARGGPNNGPPPECRIEDCLLCDEQMSGPGFQTVAARSRRRSGLLSKIARPCDVILIVDHVAPCDAAAAALDQRRGRGRGRRRRDLGRGGGRALRAPVPPEKWRPPAPEETCVYMTDDLGLLSYAGYETQNWFDDDFFATDDEKIYTTQYATCFRYEFRRAKQGYWANMSGILGGPHKAAMAFAIIAVIVGSIAVILTWTSLCVAHKPSFWTGVAVLFAVCSVSDLLTLIFFASGVCERGCAFGEGAAFAIAAGVLWAASASLALTAGPHERGAPVPCCCCPAPAASPARGGGAPSPAASGGIGTTQITVTETLQNDGAVLTERVTTNPDGSRTIETITARTMPPSAPKSVAAGPCQTMKEGPIEQLVDEDVLRMEEDVTDGGSAEVGSA